MFSPLGFSFKAIVVGFALAHACANAFGAQVKLENVTFTALGQTFSGSRVLPVGKDPLNQLAKRVEQEFDALKMIYSPQLLQAAGAKGAYSIKEHLLFLPSSVLDTKTLDPVMLHELVHARLWVELRRGKPLTFAGIAYNDRQEFKNRQYGGAFGIDEVVATLFSARYHARVMRSELNTALKSSSLAAFSGTIYSMNEARVYISRLITMLTTLQRGIEGVTHQSSIPVPEELAFLPVSIEWQSLTADGIVLHFPMETSSSELNSILEFARNSVPVLEKANTAGAKLQITDSSSRQEFLKQAETFLDLIDTVVSAFAASFPKELNLMDAIESTQLSQTLECSSIVTSLRRPNSPNPAGAGESAGRAHSP